MKEDRLRDVQSAEHKVLLSKESSIPARIPGHSRRSGNVPAADVLGKELANAANDVAILEPIHMAKRLTD
jgi:hypothetical protein